MDQDMRDIIDEIIAAGGYPDISHLGLAAREDIAMAALDRFVNGGHISSSEVEGWYSEITAYLARQAGAA